MKKRTIVFIFIIILMIFCLALSGCDELSGMSAYELAVKNGFEGTEQDWLDSLKSKSAYETAVENGYEGTEQEWLESLATAFSAYDLAVKNGFVGTEQEWLDSLNGKDGADGLDGDINHNYVEDELAQSVFSKAILSLVKISVTHQENTYFLGQITGTTEVSFGGAGVIYSLDKQNGDAYVITNFHVVYYNKGNTENKIAPIIKLNIYGMEYTDYAISAEYVGGSMTYDIAVLKISGSDILKQSNAASVALSDNTVYPGMKAIAVGNPMGTGLAVTSGIVSVDSDTVDMPAPDGGTALSLRSIRIDTAINGGNSGGGLFDKDGFLIGIVNAKVESAEIDNVAYAIPLSIAIGVTENIIEHCEGVENEEIKLCVLGIETSIYSSRAELDTETKQVFIQQKINVKTITANSVVAGILQIDDILDAVIINGVSNSINRYFTLKDIMLTTRAGDNIQFIITRGGQTVTTQTVILPVSCIVSVK